MKDFDVYKWNSMRRLAAVNENVVGQAIDAAIGSIDDSMSVTDFAKGVAYVLNEEYGSHNIEKFMSVLNTELAEPVSEGAMDRDQIAQKKFGKDYGQLGSGDKKWVDNEYEQDTHHK